MHRKKEEKNKFAGRMAALLLSMVFMVFSGCGKKATVVLETYLAGGGTEDAGEEEDGADGDGFAETEQVAQIQVHVCGAVKAPGVYGLSPGSRVFEAVSAAGGMTGDAAGDYLNLADVVFDGAKVRVPFLSEVSEDEACGPSGSLGITGGLGADNRVPENIPAPSGNLSVNGHGDTDGLVDLNHADKETLMTLPGIGEAKAEAVISWREEHGLFGSPEDIMQIPGIKEAAYEKLKDKITVKN